MQASAASSQPAPNPAFWYFQDLHGPVPAWSGGKDPRAYPGVLIQACGGSRACHTTGIGESYTAVGCIGARPLWRPRVDGIRAHPDLFPKAEEGLYLPIGPGQSSCGWHNLE